MKITETKQVVKKMVEAKLPCLLVGQPGAGKTAIVKEIAEEMGAELVVEIASLADPVQISGLPAIIDGRGELLLLSQLQRLVTVGDKPTICLIDDLGQAAPSVQAAYMQMIHARIVGQHPISDNVTFIAATNRITDRSAANPIIEALKSRFATIIALDVDATTWQLWAFKAGLDPIFPAFVKFCPQCLGDFDPTAALTNSCSPRTLHHAAKLWALGLKNDEVIFGAIGKKRGIELLAFVAISESLPSAAEILQNPEKTKIPKEIDRLLLLCSALITVAESKFSIPICKFLDRLHLEYQAFAMQGILLRDKNFKNSEGFKIWAAKSGQAIL